MIGYYLWIVVMILQCAVVTPRPSQRLRGNEDALLQYNYDAQNKPKVETNDEQVISVRITSSVAVGRGRTRTAHKGSSIGGPVVLNTPPAPIFNTALENFKTTIDDVGIDSVSTEVSPKLIGANIEFIKQLNAKKDTQTHDSDPVHPFQSRLLNQFLRGTDSFHLKSFDNEGQDFDNNKSETSKVSSFERPSQNPYYEKIPFDRSVQRSIDKLRLDRVLGPIQARTTTPNFDFDPSKNNETDDTLAEPSNKLIQTIANEDDVEVENLENVPLARSVPLSPSSKNYIQGPSNKSPSERGNSPSLTTVSFDILHDLPKQSNNHNDPIKTFTTANEAFGIQSKFYDPPKVYSQPAKIYSEPAKFYSEPAKIYSEPAKIYSEPSKIYSEPAKIYSEPAKFYSEPASLHLNPGSVPHYTPWQNPVQSTAVPSPPWQNPSRNMALSSTVVNTTPTALNTMSAGLINTQRAVEQLPEKNYEVDEKVSIHTDGRSHGVQETSTEKCKEDNCKVGYVVEGRQYKKYRVEERTPDGFIVGEYGVVRNEDGALRGVRYTADSDASPRLIYDALMKFLQLK